MNVEIKNQMLSEDHSAPGVLNDNKINTKKKKKITLEKKGEKQRKQKNCKEREKTTIPTWCFWAWNRTVCEWVDDSTSNIARPFFFSPVIYFIFLCVYAHVLSFIQKLVRLPPVHLYTFSSLILMQRKTSLFLLRLYSLCCICFYLPYGHVFDCILIWARPPSPNSSTKFLRNFEWMLSSIYKINRCMFVDYIFVFLSFTGIRKESRVYKEAKPSWRS